MVGSRPHQQGPTGSQWQDNFLNLEHGRDQKGSVHTTHTSRSHSRVGSHVSQQQQNKAMQLKIDNLKKELCYAQRKQAPFNSDTSSTDEEDASYRQRSRTPPNESFSYDEEHYHKCRYKSPPLKGLGDDTMSRVLDRISISPFTHKIRGAKLPRWFHQPMFTLYNGKTDPVEHES